MVVTLLIPGPTHFIHLAKGMEFILTAWDLKAEDWLKNGPRVSIKKWGHFCELKSWTTQSRTENDPGRV
jgi:hypothetical protein